VFVVKTLHRGAGAGGEQECNQRPVDHDTTR